MYMFKRVKKGTEFDVDRRRRPFEKIMGDI